MRTRQIAMLSACIATRRWGRKRSLTRKKCQSPSDLVAVSAPAPSVVQDPYQIIYERYETGLILIIFNRAFEESAQIFDDDLLASAALDRLTHTLAIQGPSCR